MLELLGQFCLQGVLYTQHQGSHLLPLGLQLHLHTEVDQFLELQHLLEQPSVLVDEPLEQLVPEEKSGAATVAAVGLVYEHLHLLLLALADLHLGEEGREDDLLQGGAA